MKVRGSIERGITGDNYLSFEGIPYAEAPVGHLRFEVSRAKFNIVDLLVMLLNFFQDPLPIEPWSGVKEAKSYGQTCTQKAKDINDVTVSRNMSEDCLFVNVFVRGTSVPKVKRPVMVWIHGGGWFYGSGDDLEFGPDYLMRKDIVLVTFNDRLGVFGL